jgi:LuxR family maltose regulon positive regulatory protein
VVAPPGYGKTTALGLYVREVPWPVVWVTVGDDCVEAEVFARYVAVALAPRSPLGDELRRELDSVHPRVPVLQAGLAAALAATSEPLVIVVDDVQELSGAGEALLQSLIESLPADARVVVTGTRSPSFLGGLRATDEVLELGADELAMGLEEAAHLLTGAGAAVVEPEDLEAIWRRTEGWPAGLYLAALALRRPERTDIAPEPFRGDDRFVSDFIRETVLARMPDDEVEFLIRTAVLEELSVSLCDAVLEATGSGAILQDLDDRNVFVLPLDEHRGRYRYHRLFRDCLVGELMHRDPAAVPVLHARASAWYEDHGSTDRAIDHAILGEDVARVAALLVRHGQALYFSGRAGSLARWFEWFSLHAPIERYPETAVFATWFMMITGNPVEAERWGAAAAEGARQRPMDPHLEGIRLLAEAAMCRNGPAAMAREIEVAQSMMPPASSWLPNSWIMLALTSLMGGDVETASGQLQRAVEHSEAAGTLPATAFALSELAVCALHRSELDAASRHVAAAREAVELGNLHAYSANTITLAVAARIALLHGDHDRVERLLTEADELRSKLTVALPPFAVQTRLELARCAIGLGDVRRAHRYLGEAEEIVRIRPDLGVLVDELHELAVELSERMKSGSGIAELTPAEARLLPLLTTHLSFREIGEQLFVSPHTVKTQAISIYRKLGVTSRGAAVEVARHLGLLGPS